MSRDGKPGGSGGWLYIYSDGACWGNPGPAGAGGQAIDENGRLLMEVCRFIGETTSNIAEYYALIFTLEAVGGLGCQRARICTDSQLLANQVTGGFRVKSSALKPLHQRVAVLLKEFRAVEVEHIPREKNAACDALANRAIHEGLSGMQQPVLVPDDEALF